MINALLSIDLRKDEDVVLARQRVRQIAELLTLPRQQLTAFVTAVSEISRNAVRYAGGGKLDVFLTERNGETEFGVRILDRGNGIANLNQILAGQYQSTTGMGLGIIGSKRLCDEFEIETSPANGTRVTLAMHLPNRTAITQQTIAGIAQRLAQTAPQRTIDELEAQNKELLAALDLLRSRNEEVDRLNSELSETNRGVLALYAELDEKAESLRRTSEYKSRFLSDVSHELRTPINGMISLARLLLDRIDGNLTPEQEKQVQLIHKSANSLGEIVNDLLDLAKIEAGKTSVTLAHFGLNDVLGTLRGVFRPIVADSPVSFVVDEPGDSIEMFSDELKVTQILRNLVSNAVKYTEAGEVRVTAMATADSTVTFTVVDTGIGIAAEHLEMIFSDFSQIESHLQRRVRGTGLGLPLTRKLARLLGGEVTVSSQLGRGSTFTVVLPLKAPSPDQSWGDGSSDGQQPFSGSTPARQEPSIV